MYYGSPKNIIELCNSVYIFGCGTQQWSGFVAIRSPVRVLTVRSPGWVRGDLFSGLGSDGSVSGLGS